MSASGVIPAVRPESQVAPNVTIQILRVPDCPRVARVRQLLDRGLARTGLTADVRELEGDYPSPTVLVGGADVTGRSPDMVASCRIDLPTEEQIAAALDRLMKEGLR
ncbi:MAG: hypothetical protein ACRDOD_08310 [Streptosporangiaceae bacterium]